VGIDWFTHEFSYDFKKLTSIEGGMELGATAPRIL
jgi:hypothetical protein